jgi:hypothetical protein
MPRQRAPAPEQLEALQQRLAKVQRQIRLVREREKNAARRDDAHRKIIAGALALEHAEKNPDTEFARTLHRLLDEYARPDDRRLFPFLPAREAPPPPPAESEPPASTGAAA